MRGQVGIVPSEGRGQGQACGIAGISGKPFCGQSWGNGQWQTVQVIYSWCRGRGVLSGQQPCGVLSWCSGQQPGGVLCRAGTSGIGAC